MDSEYEFRIKGRVSPELLATFAPLHPQPDTVQTVLVGVVTDSAELHGIIARFETLGLSLLEFRCLPERQRGSGSPDSPLPETDDSSRP
jgi:hypothetical protein